MLNSTAIIFSVTINEVETNLNFLYQFSNDYSRITITDTYGKSKTFVKT